MVKFLGRQHVEAEKELLKEGHVYAFSRFLVCPNKSKYRAVDSKFMIELTYYTRIQELNDVPPDFPVYAYKLVSFTDLPAYVGETRTFVGMFLRISAMVLPPNYYTACHISRSIARRLFCLIKNTYAIS